MREQGYYVTQAKVQKYCWQPEDKYFLCLEYKIFLGQDCMQASHLSKELIQNLTLTQYFSILSIQYSILPAFTTTHTHRQHA